MLLACAEDAIADVSPLPDVKIGSTAYSFDAPPEAFEAQGIPITVPELKPDCWLNANDAVPASTC